MTARPQIPIRSIIVGGIAALIISIIGAFLANDASGIWWHVGTIGAPVGITLLLSLVPTRSLRLARRIFLVGALSLVVILGIAYSAGALLGISSNQIGTALGNRNSIAAGVAFAGFASVMFFPRRQFLIAALTVAALIFVASRTALIAFLIGFLVYFVFRLRGGSRLRWWHIAIAGLGLTVVAGVFFAQPLIAGKIHEYNRNNVNRISPLTEEYEDAWNGNQNAQFSLQFVSEEAFPSVAHLQATKNPDAAHPNVILNQSYQRLPATEKTVAGLFIRSNYTSNIILSTNIANHQCEVSSEWTWCETPIIPGGDRTITQFQLRYPAGVDQVDVYLANPTLRVIEFPSAVTSPCQENCVRVLKSIHRVIERFGVTGWSSDQNVTNRVAAQQFALQRFVQRPVAGYGLETFRNDFVATHPDYSAVNHPHSALLQIMYERGTLGVISLLVLLAGIIIAVRPARYTLVPLLVFMLALQTADSTFYFNLVYYPFWITLGLLRKSPVQTGADSQHRTDAVKISTRFTVILDFLVFAAAIFVARQAVTPHSGANIFLLYLGIGSLATWALSRRKGTDVLWTARSEVKALSVPLGAAVFALVASTVARTYYSLFATVLFALTAMVGLVLIRLVFRNMHPPAPALLVGTSAIHELPLSSATIEYQRWHPQARGNDYQFVVVGDENYDEDAFREWVKRQHRPRYTAMSVNKALELFHGRIPATTISADWVAASKAAVQSYLPYKRVLESAMIILFSPLIIMVALVTAFLVLISVGRPVIFQQQRVGLNNQPFTIYKFRTMRGSRNDGAAFADEETERITKIGRVLRGFRLDEIPQFWNVLKGDMSIIGPRPEQVEFAKQFEHELPAYAARHVVRPGITGWAQVNQGYAAGADETLDKLSYDFFYIKHFSPWLDIVIVGRTVLTILTKFGAK